MAGERLWSLGLTAEDEEGLRGMTLDCWPLAGTVLISLAQAGKLWHTHAGAGEWSNLK